MTKKIYCLQCDAVMNDLALHNSNGVPRHSSPQKCAEVARYQRDVLASLVKELHARSGYAEYKDWIEPAVVEALEASERHWELLGEEKSK